MEQAAKAEAEGRATEAEKAIQDALRDAESVASEVEAAHGAVLARLATEQVENTLHSTSRRERPGVGV